MSRRKLPLDELCDRIITHMTSCHGSLSRGDLARALGLPVPATDHARLMQALWKMEADGRVMAVAEPRDEHDRRPIIRWRLP